MKSSMLVIIGAALALSAAQAHGAEPADGEEIYASVCRNCHGPTGKGMASFPSLSGNDADYIGTRLTQYRAGETVGPNTPLMSPMAVDLSDEDIANLAAYISTEFQ
ncbi:MAG: c-type cytochrome [Rhodobacteraceae bacterium]|nr:c-type cytochrome [Paracoccaceae bacterium]